MMASLLWTLDRVFGSYPMTISYPFFDMVLEIRILLLLSIVFWRLVVHVEGARGYWRREVNFSSATSDILCHHWLINCMLFGRDEDP